MAADQPSAARADAELSEVDLLMRVARKWRHLGVRDAAARSLTPHAERALLTLARLARREPGVRISHLAEHLGIAPRSATEVADALEQVGLIERSPDPTDRRAVLLRLTDEGRSTVTLVRDRRREAAEEAMTVLSAADRAELRRMLHALLSSGPAQGSS